MDSTSDRDVDPGDRGDSSDHSDGNRPDSRDRGDSNDHGGDAGGVTERVHDNSWSANLEEPRHEGDRERVIAEAIEAVEHTTAGNHVNLVTHGANGHPSEYLYGALEETLGDVDVEYVERCGCGGHVTRVHVG